LEQAIAEREITVCGLELETGTVARNAVAWAKARLGSGVYALRCLAFAEDAVEKGNGIEIFGGEYAKESADLYGAAEQTGAPPEAAFVFYNCSGEIGGIYRNWGHVGLSLGDGRVIHAWGRVRIDPYSAVEKLENAPGWSAPRMIGWAPVERVLLDAVARPEWRTKDS
jgi:hypothetical protein